MKRLPSKDNARRGVYITAILSTLAVMTSCASTTPQVRPTALGDGSPGNPWVVTIHFETQTSCTITHVTEDPATCPNTQKSGFCVGRNKRIRWVSDPTGIKYDIYYDPIQGQPMHSNANGIMNKHIDAAAPYSLYKYSILRDGCDSTKYTHEPHIRIDD